MGNREVRPPFVVEGLRARVEGLKKAVGGQAALEGPGSANPQRALQAVAARLRAVFGERSVLRASDMEQPRRARVMRAWQDALGPF
jgi:hypothetical protein